MKIFSFLKSLLKKDATPAAEKRELKTITITSVSSPMEYFQAGVELMRKQKEEQRLKNNT